MRVCGREIILPQFPFQTGTILFVAESMEVMLALSAS